MLGGRVYFVDVHRGRSFVEEQAPERRRLLGGGGLLATDLLLRHTRPGLDPFDPRALIVFASGPMTSLPEIGLPRFALVAKSPLSGGIGESRVSGPYGIGLRGAGLDALAIGGCARSWSYLLLDHGRARVVPASDLLGLDSAEKTDELRRRHGTAAAVAVIGPAGERLVRFASIVCDYGYVASRLGLGAVLGSKRLLGVVIVGHRPSTMFDPANVRRLSTRARARIPRNPLAQRQKQPPGFGAWPGPGREGYLGVQNFRTSDPGDLSAFAAGRFLARIGDTSSCPGCPQDCLKRYPSPGLDPRAGVLHEEAVAAFGVNLAIHDLDRVLALNALCVRWGLDPVSAAFTISALAEANADGALDPALEPAAPQFGDGAAITSLCEDIARRRGVGAELGEGCARLAHRHPSLRPYAMHSKGVEIGPWDPRGSHGQALAYAVSPLGPRYDSVEHDIDFDPLWGAPSYIARARRHGCPPGGLPMASLGDQKLELLANLWELWSGYDVLGLCTFVSPPTRVLDEEEVLELASAVTGWDVTAEEISIWGTRRLRTMREYNRREGLTPDQDDLPRRFFTEPVNAGRMRGAKLDRDAFLRGRAWLRARWDGHGEGRARAARRPHALSSARRDGP